MAFDSIVIERALLKSEPFRRLSSTAMAVYFDFRRRCKVKKNKPRSGRAPTYTILNNGELVYTYAEAEKRKPPISRKSFARALDQLIEYGFLDIDHPGNGGWKGDVSKYSISDRWQAWGTDAFIHKTRQKDIRQGRGFKKGNTYGRNSKPENIPLLSPGKRRKSSIMGVKNDTPISVGSDTPRAGCKGFECQE